MVSKIVGYTLPLVCGAFLLAGCVTNDNERAAIDLDLTKTEAFFPVVDALSSASILRVNPHTMAYVGERTGTSYKLNKVDLDDPDEKTSQDIGGDVAVITAGGGKIGIIQAVEGGYETFAGSYTKIYDAVSLKLLKTFPLAPPAAGNRRVEPLHHRDPSLTITDKYAVVLTEDDGFFGSSGAQQYISVYDIAGDKKASHTNAFSGEANGARGDSNPALSVGTLMGAVVNGDYLILGGSMGTAVFKIDASGDTLAITKVADQDGTGNHWFKGNGSYVLESKSNTGKVKVWKWNGADAPIAVGEVDVNGNTNGNVQALCFDPDNPATTYFYCKLAAGTGNGGKVYSVDLSAQGLPKTELFSFSHWVIGVTSRGNPTPTYYDCPLTGLWTIEKQKAGNDDYFVFSGSYSYNNNATTVGAVFTIKNPKKEDNFGGTYTSDSNATLDTTGKVTVETFTAPWNTAVRTLKTFKSTSGDVYFAAKNYTASGAASQYKLVLEKMN